MTRSKLSWLHGLFGDDILITRQHFIFSEKRDLFFVQITWFCTPLKVLFQLIFLYPVRMPHHSLTASSEFVQLLLIYVHQYYHMTRNFVTSGQLCPVVQSTQELILDKSKFSSLLCNFSVRFSSYVFWPVVLRSCSHMRWLETLREKV